MSQTATLPGNEAERLLSAGSLTVGQVKAEFGLGRTTLYELMQKGELPYTSCGRRRLIPRQALVEMLARNLVGAN